MIATPSPKRQPRRVQMSRQHPWRADNPDAVIVSRPSRWGNPCHWYPRPTVELTATGMTLHPADPAGARAISVQGFREQLADPDARAFNGYPSDAEIRAAHAGRDLACWCPLDQPCHADVLLEIANGATP